MEQTLAYREDIRLQSAPDRCLGLELAWAHLPDLIQLDLPLPDVPALTDETRDGLARARKIVQDLKNLRAWTA